MDNQVFSFAQTYLSTLLNLNILLATVCGFLFLQKKRTSCLRVSALISIIICIISIVLIFYSYKEFFSFLMRYDPKENMNIYDPFKPLGLVFILDVIAIIIISVSQFFWIFNKE